MVMNHYDSAFNRHPNPARGCAESVNWNLKGAQIAKMFWPWLIAIGAGRIGIDRLHVDRRIGIGFQEDERIMMLRTPLQGLGTAGAGNPDRRVGFLQRRFEGIDHPEMVMGAFPAERSGGGPGLDNQVVRFLKALTVVER